MMPRLFLWGIADNKKAAEAAFSVCQAGVITRRDAPASLPETG